jgi:UDP-N-acetylmuramoyl-tripeptide--D-alanyl-D-alanine ligase
MSTPLLTLAEVAAMLGTACTGDGARACTRVVTDSRNIAAGDLFVALKGERFDGHDFLPAVFAADAAGALVETGHAALAALPTSAACVTVPDPLAALGQLAAAWRARATATVVGVTGSSGKTTIKEMIAAILRHTAGEAAVLATEGNLNNHIGVPLMLLRLRPTHRFAVIEMGMNHAGEIRYLTGLARPQVAVIGNAGTAHIEHLGSRQGIAAAKAEIFEGLDTTGVAVINLDDDFAAYWQGLLAGRAVLGFSSQRADAPVRAEGLALGATDSRFTLITPQGSAPVTLPVPGRHMVQNALAAAAVAHALGLASTDIAAGLAGFKGIKGRLQRHVAPCGATVIDDSYNANPDSMHAAVDVLAGQPGMRWLVLGDMGEIDDVAGRHAEIGAYARGKDLAGLLATGEGMRHAVAAYGQGGEWFDSPVALAAALAPRLDAHSTVLVKGSRFMRMEQVVAALLTAAAPHADAHASAGKE